MVQAPQRIIVVVVERERFVIARRRFGIITVFVRCCCGRRRRWQSCYDHCVACKTYLNSRLLTSLELWIEKNVQRKRKRINDLTVLYFLHSTYLQFDTFRLKTDNNR